MYELSKNPTAFIRPSPSSGALGGVARATRAAIVLCEAAGFDTLLIETVGVGQSETEIHSMVDFFLLLMLAGAGDELQGIKRGIMELADLLVINKADGDNLTPAKKARTTYKNALHLFPPKDSGWTPKVALCSALEKTGIETIWQEIERYAEQTSANGYFERHRNLQNIQWMNQAIEKRLVNHFKADPAVNTLMSTLEAKVRNGEVSPFKAAEELLQVYKGEKG
jgi:LAO/AO transport system kinase